MERRRQEIKCIRTLASGSMMMKMALKVATAKRYLKMEACTEAFILEVKNMALEFTLMLRRIKHTSSMNHMILVKQANIFQSMIQNL